jgi:hypothetical protein
MISSVVLVSGCSNPSEPDPLPKPNSMFGTYITPRDFPEGLLIDENVDEYLQLNRDVGAHVANLRDWENIDEYPELEAAWDKIEQLVRNNGFIYFVHFSPLTPMTREDIAPPPDVNGNSFSNPEVKEDFIEKVLELASLGPDVLGIGIEVNILLFHGNQEEYDQYVIVAKETYDAIKKTYPSQTVTISFFWELMKREGNFDILEDFKDSLDVYSFTSYPNLFTVGDPADLPYDFYSSIRDYLPTERIAISEIDWYSGADGSEKLQAAFFKRLPDLLEGLNPEFVTITYLYDVPFSFVNDEKWASMSLIRNDGARKASWDVVKNYP